MEAVTVPFLFAAKIPSIRTYQQSKWLYLAGIILFNFFCGFLPDKPTNLNQNQFKNYKNKLLST
jgi:hypothetical protein